MEAGAGRVGRSLGRGVALLAVAGAAFVGGYEFAGGDEEAGSTTFHDMRVRTVPELVELVAPDVPEVRAAALKQGTPEQAYLFVRDAILYHPSLPLAPPVRTLATGRGSCLSKAALLASLYRALGMGHDQVRVVAGLVLVEGEPMQHAWLEIEWEGRCLQQDPTSLLGVFDFDEFPDCSYARGLVDRELFCFNDKGFAVVSASNRFRGGADPHQRVSEEQILGALPR